MEQRVFAVRHRVLPGVTKVIVDDDPEYGTRGELFYFIPPVLPTSQLLMEVFQGPSEQVVLAQVQQWIRDHFGSEARFEELPE